MKISSISVHNVTFVRISGRKQWGETVWWRLEIHGKDDADPLEFELHTVGGNPPRIVDLSAEVEKTEEKQEPACD